MAKFRKLLTPVALKKPSTQKTRGDGVPNIGISCIAPAAPSAVSA
ncbi:hypothetical protein [Neisseria weixii]|nr:hypothetical protein [Neisseria weixii]